MTLRHDVGFQRFDVNNVVEPTLHGLNWRLLGSMCISGPGSRLTRAKREKYAKRVIRAANQLSYALAGGRAATPKALSRWHP